MQIGTFRKNVMRTVATKAAKLGLRGVAKNTLRTNVFHATVDLKTNVGHLLQALAPYIIGVQFSQEMREHAAVSLGDMGYDLTILCRSLKVKMPSATKKSKLQGTRTAALLHLSGLVTDMLGVEGTGVFTGPAMTTIQKVVTLPNKGGAKEERLVAVVNTEAEATAETARQESLKQLLSAAVDIYWRLCFDILGAPPVGVLEAKFARLQAQYPGVEFDVTEKAPVQAGEAQAAQPKEKKAKAPGALVNKKAKKAEDTATA